MERPSEYELWLEDWERRHAGEPPPPHSKPFTVSECLECGRTRLLCSSSKCVQCHHTEPWTQERNRIRAEMVAKNGDPG